MARGQWFLGLDVGTDSIGWAAFAGDGDELEPVRLLDGGVRLFDSGRDPQEQTSLERDRGIKRRTRRVFRARRWRREKLGEMLLSAGLISPDDATRDDLIRQPYTMRAAALDRVLDGEELWTVLMHLGRHRGFRSNRIERQQEGKPEAEDESGLWIGRENNLRERLVATCSRTVGELFCRDLAAGHPVRMRHGTGTAATRALLEEEFHAIVRRQREGWPDLDWDGVRELLFEQRPLWAKDAGPCEVFPEESRALKAGPAAQDYLLRQNLANLRLVEIKQEDVRPLNEEEYARALDLLRRERRVEWSRLRTAIGLRGRKFTIEVAGQGGKKASKWGDGHQTDALLAPVIDGWEQWDVEHKEQVFSSLWNARQRRRELLAAITAELSGTDAETAETIADIVQFELPTGRIALSARAAALFCRHARAGLKAHEIWEEAFQRPHANMHLSGKILDRLPYYGEVVPGLASGGSHDPRDKDKAEAYFGRAANISVHIALNQMRRIINDLIHRYGAPPRRIVVETTRELRAGAEERKNTMRKQASEERDNAAIDMELRAQGQWLANPRERRRRWRLYKRQQGLCPYTGKPIGRADLLSAVYEVDHVIPLARGGRDVEDNLVLCRAEANAEKGNRTPWEAFGADPAWQVIRDDFLSHLDKESLGVMEWRFGDGAAARAEKQAKAGEDWAERQLNDTAYIATATRAYLSCLGVQVIATPGRLTGWLRQAWDIQINLRPYHLFPVPKNALEDDDVAETAVKALEPPYLRKALESLIKAVPTPDSVPDAGYAARLRQALGAVTRGKSRLDHRHHYLDAAVIAMTTPRLVQWLNTQHARHGRLPDPHEVNLPEPYDGYRAQIMRHWSHVWPSLRPQVDAEKSAAGALHGERPLGVRRDGEKVRLVQRRRADELYQSLGKHLPDDKVAEKLDQIAEPRTRQRLTDFIVAYRAADATLSLAAATAKAVADTRWGPRGMTRITLTERTRDAPVGLWDGDLYGREVDGIVWGFRGNPKAAVPTDGNAVYQIWRVALGKGREKWESRIITRFTLASGASLAPPTPGALLVMELRRGDVLFLPQVGGGTLFFVKKMAVDGRLYVWPLRNATGKAMAPLVQGLFRGQDGINLNEHEGYKFSSADGLRKAGASKATVTPLGRVRLERPS